MPKHNECVTTLTYLEFYSGVGGWTMALEQACCRINSGQERSGDADGPNVDGRRMRRLRLRRLSSFDHSDVCNAVFQHNFSGCDRQKRTESPHDKAGQTNGGDGSAHARASRDIRTEKKRRRAERRGTPMTSPASTTSDAKPVAIERLSRRKIEEYDADVWAMSPPCQPHTRQHDKRDEELNDPRSKSFLHLIELIKTIDERNLPRLLLMENVVGFEMSESCRLWKEALSEREYHVGHFHLTPTQVGIPNDRPRYYCVAILRHSGIGGGREVNHEFRTAGEVDTSIGVLRARLDPLLRSETRSRGPCSATEGADGPNLDIPVPNVQNCIKALCVSESQTDDVGADASLTPLNRDLPPIADFLDADLCTQTTSCIDEEKLAALRVPGKTLSRNAAWCFDIVTPSDRRSSCFTHSYGKFVRGTGSVLYTGERKKSAAGSSGAGLAAKATQSEKRASSDHASTVASSESNPRSSGASEVDECDLASDEAGITERFKLVPPDRRNFDENWSNGLDLQNDLRYFSGTEIARLMGFPTAAPSVCKTSSSDGMQTFAFPESCTVKQQWKLLGNSLNVRVAARVSELGLRLLDVT